MLVAESLMKIVKQLEPEAIIEGPLAEVKLADKWFRENTQPDLVLADIQLSDGISFDIFSENNITCPVIFTTAYNEYAIRAFKVNSIDYLLKPIDKEELQAAFDKFHLLQSKFSDAAYIKDFKALIYDFKKTKSFKERFAVHVGRSITLVDTGEVAVFIKEQIIFLINKENRRFITDFRSLDEVEELVDPAVFFRANRQYLVHLPFIESYRADDTGKLHVKLRAFNNFDIIVSKEKAADFRKWFSN